MYILLFLYNIFYIIDINKYGLLGEKFNKNTCMISFKHTINNVNKSLPH